MPHIPGHWIVLAARTRITNHDMLIAARFAGVPSDGQGELEIGLRLHMETGKAANPNQQIC
jgi:hypothetical protein